MDAEKEYLNSLKATAASYKRLEKTLENLTKTLERLVKLHEQPKSKTTEKPQRYIL